MAGKGQRANDNDAAQNERTPTSRDETPQKRRLGGTSGSRDETRHKTRPLGTQLGPRTLRTWRDLNEGLEDSKGWDD
ncbi:hypothetical protein PSPO01_15315 [Paraphaeosphaeria sporulosa]